MKNPHNLPLHHVHCTLRVEVHDHGEDHGEDHDDDHGEDHDDDEFDEIIIMGTLIIHDDHDSHAGYEDDGDADYKDHDDADLWQDASTLGLLSRVSQTRHKPWVTLGHLALSVR